MFSEVSSASRTEEEEGGEVRDGRDDRDAAHLYRLVSSALHVSGQICGRSRQQTAGRVCHHHAGWLSGTALIETCLSPSRWVAFRYCCS